MTQEQKDKMEQEVRAYTIPYIRNHGQHIGDIVKQDFTSIYQTILDNPGQYGLYTIEEMRKSFYAGHSLCDDEWRDKTKLIGFDEFIDSLK